MVGLAVQVTKQYVHLNNIIHLGCIIKNIYAYKYTLFNIDLRSAESRTTSKQYVSSGRK